MKKSKAFKKNFQRYLTPNPGVDMRLAIEALDSQFSGIETFQKLQVSTYPNPFKEVFYIKGTSTI